jgi:hypothetical protein
MCALMVVVVGRDWTGLDKRAVAVSLSADAHWPQSSGTQSRVATRESKRHSALRALQLPVLTHSLTNQPTNQQTDTHFPSHSAAASTVSLRSL